MTTHLSSDDLAAAADGTLAGAGRAHLDECAACRAAVSELSALMAELTSDAVPEPSPFFWALLSHRVGEATRNESAPVRGVWTFGRPVLAFGALAAAALLLFLWSSSPRGPASDLPPALATAGDGAADTDVAWQAMSEIAAAMTAEDVQRATASAPERSTVLSELSDDERRAFIELLKREIGEVQ